LGSSAFCSSLPFLRRLYRHEASASLMVTFGLALALGEIVRLAWDPEALPRALAGIIFLVGEPFPTYRCFLPVPE
jgi:branched-chain amino acid transport system permease protein